MIPVRRQNLEMKLPHLERAAEWLSATPVSDPPLSLRLPDKAQVISIVSTKNQ